MAVSTGVMEGGMPRAEPNSIGLRVLEAQRCVEGGERIEGFIAIRLPIETAYPLWPTSFDRSSGIQ